MKPWNLEIMPTKSALFGGVSLHQGSFFISQAPFLSEQWGELFMDLSDVVQ